MSNIAFLCTEDLAGLFQPFGIDAVILKEREDPAAVLERLVDRNYRIIYILETIASGFISAIDAARRRGLVSIVIVPDHISDLGLGMELTRLAAIDAIGSDMMFKAEKGEEK